MSADQLGSPTLYAGDNAHAVWRDLRATQPVAWTSEPDGPGFWSVVRYGDGTRLLKDWQSFSSVPGTTLEGNRWEDDPAAGKMLPLLDPPRHDVLRRAVLPFFAQRRLAAVEAECRAFLPTLLIPCTEQGRFDAGHAIGTRLPMHVSFRMLGIPTSDEEGLIPVIRGTLSCDEAERYAADAELLMYLADLLAEWRRKPVDNLLSAIAAVEIDGALLSDETVLLTFTNLLSAGLTTTRLAINGGIHAFASYPAQWQRLRTEPALVASAVEEILRWTSPALAVLRTARDMVLVGDQQILPRQRIAVWLPSLNRDERMFENADEFHLDRVPNSHVGFGTGVHTCLGMALARIELALLLAALPQRWKTIALDGPPSRLRSLVLHGIDRLPVLVQPA
jgi:cytochrome P450